MAYFCIDGEKAENYAKSSTVQCPSDDIGLEFSTVYFIATILRMESQ